MMSYIEIRKKIVILVHLIAVGGYQYRYHDMRLLDSVPLNYSLKTRVHSYNLV